MIFGTYLGIWEVDDEREKYYYEPACTVVAPIRGIKQHNVNDIKLLDIPVRPGEWIMDLNDTPPPPHIVVKNSLGASG